MLKLFCVAVLTTLVSMPSDACGIATHAWVSKVAITKVDGELRTFLEQYRDVVYNGSYFPDSGYSDWICQASYGESAHWPPFMNHYLDYIKETCRWVDGTVLTTGDCGKLIAYFFGAASHGLTDAWHDSHFLVKMVELGYFANEEDAQSVTDRGLDATAVNNPLFGITDDVPEPDAKPPLEHIVAILNRTSLAGSLPLVDFEMVKCGTELMSLTRMMESVWAEYKEPGYLLLIPAWALEHRLDAPGGIYDNASHVASFWKEFWIQITEQPASQYRPKRLWSSGGWPRVKIGWELVSPTQTKTKSQVP